MLSSVLDRSDLTLGFVSTCREPVATSLCEHVRCLENCPRMASSDHHVLLFLPIGLPFEYVFMRRERIWTCPSVGAGGLPWRRLRHWTCVICTGSSARRLLVQVRNRVSVANIKTVQECVSDSVGQSGVYLAFGTGLVQKSLLSTSVSDWDDVSWQVLSDSAASQICRPGS